jgi:general stress protein YciG
LNTASWILWNSSAANTSTSIKTENGDEAMSTPGGKQRRGFASMSSEKQREIASKGGRAAHVKGTAHEWTPDEARSAGRKGAQASRDGRGRPAPDQAAHGNNEPATSAETTPTGRSAMPGETTLDSGNEASGDSFSMAQPE